MENCKVRHEATCRGGKDAARIRQDSDFPLPRSEELGHSSGCLPSLPVAVAVNRQPRPGRCRAGAERWGRSQEERQQPQAQEHDSVGVAHDLKHVCPSQTDAESAAMSLKCLPKKEVGGAAPQPCPARGNLAVGEARGSDGTSQLFRLPLMYSADVTSGFKRGTSRRGHNATETS